MTRPTIEEALFALEHKVLAWRLSPNEPGQCTLSLFSLATGGAVQNTWSSYPEAKMEGITKVMHEAGFPVGAYDDYVDYVWLAHGGELTVWDDKQVILKGKGGTITRLDGIVVEVENIQHIVTTVSDDLVQQLIAARLIDGTAQTLIAHSDLNAWANPTHNYNDHLMESTWHWELATVIAAFAGKRCFQSSGNDS